MLECCKHFRWYEYFSLFFALYLPVLGWSKCPLVQEEITNVEDGVLLKEADLSMDVVHQVPISNDCRILINLALDPVYVRLL